MAHNFKITNPSAAVIIWNYDSRLSSAKKTDKVEAQAVDKMIISTLSCTHIKTSKSKSDPQGTFEVGLAPNKNWVSAITPGSWCAILISNEPLTKKDFITVDPKKLKMIGKVDSVRLQSSIDPTTGANVGQYYMTGVDWGHVFHNSLYVDNNLAAAATTPGSKALGDPFAVAMAKALFGPKGYPERLSSTANIKAILKIMGQELSFSSFDKEVGTIAKAVYSFNMPTEMALYLKLISASKIPTTVLNGLIDIKSGVLVAEDTYKDFNESYSFLNPYSLQGTHTIWQIFQDLCNPALNEMIAEMVPSDTGTKLTLYKRIRPFVIQKTSSAYDQARAVTSYFQNVKKHDIDPITIKSINVGTNWRDKYNFVEIKPQWQETPNLQANVKRDQQVADIEAFEREGFRPMIVNTHHFPTSPLSKSNADVVKIDISAIQSWRDIIALWHFDTHKMLNGTVSMTGTSEYIGVGDNIRIDASILNRSNNFNSNQKSTPLKTYLLAHVENIQHAITVSPEGTKQFVTTIQFVRGIVVNGSGLPLTGSASAIDNKASDSSDDDITNNIATTVTASADDPNKGFF